MVILHVDITFDDYNTSILNTRNLQQQMSTGPQRPSPGNLNQSYFYTTDNPQCSNTLENDSQPLQTQQRGFIPPNVISHQQMI